MPQNFILCELTLLGLRESIEHVLAKGGGGEVQKENVESRRLTPVRQVTEGSPGNNLCNFYFIGFIRKNWVLIYRDEQKETKSGSVGKIISVIVQCAEPRACGQLSFSSGQDRNREGADWVADRGEDVRRL